MKRSSPTGSAACRASVEVHDEGQVDPIGVVEQGDANGNPLLLVAEELFVERLEPRAPTPGGHVGADDVPAARSRPVSPVRCPDSRYVPRARRGRLAATAALRQHVRGARARLRSRRATRSTPRSEPGLVSAPIRYVRKEVATAPVVLRAAVRRRRAPAQARRPHQRRRASRPPTCRAPPGAAQGLANAWWSCTGWSIRLRPDTPARAAEREHVRDHPPPVTDLDRSAARGRRRAQRRQCRPPRLLPPASMSSSTSTTCPSRSFPSHEATARRCVLRLRPAARRPRRPPPIDPGRGPTRRPRAWCCSPGARG